MRLLLFTTILLLFVALSTGCRGTDHQGYLSGANIQEFKGCYKVQGNLVIDLRSLTGNGSSVPPVTLEELLFLSNINEITGYLEIKNLNSTNITNLRFLQSLEVIGGDDTVEIRAGQEFSLIIEENEYLQTLGLSSLREISYGGVKVSKNPQLCLVDTLNFDDYLVSSSQQIRTGGLATDCTAFNCHSQCSTGKGCWGTLADECVECRQYQFMGICIPTCDLNVSVPDDSTRQCVGLTPPTAPLVTTPTTSTISQTRTPTTSQIQTPTQVTNNDSTLTRSATTDSDSTLATPTTVNALGYWPFFTIAGFVVVFAVLLLSALCAIGYCWLRSSKVHKKFPPLKRSGSVSSETQSDIASSQNSHYSGDKRQRSPTSGHHFYSQTNSTTSMQDTTDNKGNSGSPTLSKRSTSRQSEKTQDSGGPQSNNIRQSVPSLGMPGGVYSTRTPPSHPRRLSHHSGASHTLSERGSVSSFQGGWNLRSNGRPSRSKSINSGTSNRTETKSQWPVQT